MAKNHKERVVPLMDSMLETIAGLEQQAENRQPVGYGESRFSREYVFVTGHNTPWKRSNLLDRFYDVCEKAGIEGAHCKESVDIHSLRVSYVTFSLNHGAKPKAVQEIVGHSTLAMTTDVYAKATDSSIREAVDILPLDDTREIVWHTSDTRSKNVPKTRGNNGMRNELPFEPKPTHRYKYTVSICRTGQNLAA